MIFSAADKNYYLRHNLIRDPFPRDTIDKILYLTPELSRRLDFLKQRIKTGDRLLVVVSPPGGGKSVIAEHLSSLRDPDWMVGMVQGRINLDKTSLSLSILNHIFPYHNFESSQAVGQIRKLLESATLNGKIPVFIIDDAHELSNECLLLLLELAGFRCSGSSYRIVWFANESINDRLASAELHKHAAGIVQELNLPPFSTAQTREYIENRLTLSGAVKNSLFSENELAQIYKISAGLPGGINLLASQLMQNKYGETAGTGRWPVRMLSATGSVLVLAAVLTYYLYMPGGASGDGSVTSQAISPGRPLEDGVPVPEPVSSETETGHDFEQKIFEARVSMQLTETIPTGGQKDNTPAGAGHADTATVPENVPPAVDMQLPGRDQRQTAPVSDDADPARAVNGSGSADETGIQAKTIAGGAGPDIDNVYRLDSVPEVARGINGPAWFRQQSQDLFVLQILSAGDFNNVEQMLKKIPEGQGQLSGYTNYTPSGNPRYLLYYGLYPDRQTAYAAIKDIPLPLQEINPWPRDLKSINNQLNKLESRGYY